MYWSGRAVEESDEASQDGPSSVWKVFDGVFRSLHEWTYLCNHFNISKDMNVALTGPPFAKTSLCAQHVSAGVWQEEFSLNFGFSLVDSSFELNL